MKPEKKHRGLLPIILFLALTAPFYIGFFFTDPLLQGMMAKGLLWGGRLGIPIGALAVVALYYWSKTLRAFYLKLTLIFLGCFLPVLLGYPFFEGYYQTRFLRAKADLYHPYLQLQPPPYTPRTSSSATPPLKIFCLGGSTTEFKDTHGKGWPERLETILNERAGEGNRKIETHNLGKQWYTTQHSLINYTINLRQHKPDLILVMHSVNDLMQNADFSHLSFGEFREDYSHFYGPIYRLINRNTLPGVLWTTFRSVWYHRPREQINTDTFPGLTPFTRNLSNLIELAQTDQIPILLLTQPYLENENMTPQEEASLTMLRFEAVGHGKQWSLQTAISGLTQYNQAVRNLAAEKGVPLIDVEKAMPKQHTYLWDDVHYTPKGFDLVADTIARDIQSQIKPVLKQSE